MQPWGPRGMVWYWHKWEVYPAYSDGTSVEYKFSGKQMGPRGKLPICPPTCFAAGGTYPSNHLSVPPDTGAHYYDTIKGSGEGPEVLPEPEGSLSIHSGPLFHANTSDLKSADIKWFEDASGRAWVVWIGANNTIYAQTVEQVTVGETTDYLHWETDLEAQFQTEHPLTGSSETSTPYRSIRLDPKRSIITKGYLILFMSVCDWEIKPGSEVTFTDKDYLGRLNTNFYCSLTCDNETGEITNYDPVTDDINIGFGSLTYSVLADDSYRILNYAHYYVVTKLSDGLTTITKYIEEDKSGKMPMSIAPKVPVSGIDWSLLYRKYYSMGVTYKSGWAYPDNIYPPCVTDYWWSNSAMSADSLTNHLASYPGLDTWFDPGKVTCYWVEVTSMPDHDIWTSNKSVTETMPVEIAWLSVSVNRDTGNVVAPPSGVPSDNAIANALISEGASDPADIWALPVPSAEEGRTRYDGTGGSWEWWQSTQHPLKLYVYPLGYPEPPNPPYCGLHQAGGQLEVASEFSDFEDWVDGEDKFPKWEPWPYAKEDWVDGDELLSDNEDVFEDCLCSDSYFSDLTVVDDSDTVSTVYYIRWGKNGAAFATGDDLFIDRETGATLKQPINKNNNPEVHQDLRANMFPYLCKMVITVNTESVITNITVTDTLLVFSESDRKAGYYVDGVFTEYGKRYNSGMHSGTTNSNIELAMGTYFGSPAMVRSENYDAIAGMVSADIHALNTFGYADYNEKARLCGGTTSVGRHQQIVIPFTPKNGVLGDILFISTAGAMENDVFYTDWYSGQGASKSQTWLDDMIYKGCLATGTITHPMLLKKSGTSYTITDLLGSGIFGKEFCKWAARVDLTNATSGAVEEWLITARQLIDYRGTEPAAEEEFEIIAQNLYNYETGVPTEVNLTPMLNSHLHGVLSDAYAITPMTADATNAWVFFCYNDLENKNRLVRAALSDTGCSLAKDVAADHFYDQFIVEEPQEGSSKIYLYALCVSCGTLDIIDTSDLSVKKTITTNWGTMTSGVDGGIIGRKDSVGNPDSMGVKTVVSYYKYDPTPEA